MDPIEKELARLSARERASFRELLERIKAGNFTGLDLQKLRGERDVYRVRKGDHRVIFRRRGSEVKILAFERRTTTTYRKRRK